ncbi:MAG: NADH-quinone oxidoreductase subunit J, partial [Verrucomicrobiota bacterium]
LKTEEKQAPKFVPVIGGLGIVLAFTIQLLGILGNTPNKDSKPIDYDAASAFYAESSPKVAERLANKQLPDVNLVGNVIFTDYNFPLQIVGVLLLVATIGVVVLSKRQAV